jgi:hypothetical protein
MEGKDNQNQKKWNADVAYLAWIKAVVRFLKCGQNFC